MPKGERRECRIEWVGGGKTVPSVDRRTARPAGRPNGARAAGRPAPPAEWRPAARTAERRPATPAEKQPAPPAEPGTARSTERPVEQRTRIRTVIAGTLVGALLLPGFPGLGPTAAAARTNPILIMLKDALYGGAAGLLLGGVTALVVDDDDRGDALRWGVVLGTFGGFGYGIYETTRAETEFSGLPVPHGGRAASFAPGDPEAARFAANAGSAAALPVRGIGLDATGPARLGAGFAETRPRLQAENQAHGGLPW